FAEFGNQVAIVKRPGGIAVEHDDGIARAFIHVMIFQIAEREIVRLKRIEPLETRRYHSTPSMRQFNPLPMPRRASFSPRRTCPASMLSAIVTGSDAEPMLPKNSTVG